MKQRSPTRYLRSSPVSPIRCYFGWAGRYKVSLKIKAFKKCLGKNDWDPIKIHYFQGFLGSFILRHGHIAQLYTNHIPIYLSCQNLASKENDLVCLQKKTSACRKSLSTAMILGRKSKMKIPYSQCIKSS